MSQASLISEEMRQDIGVDWEPWTQEIDKRFIRKFAEAIEDSNPLWQDEVEARKTPYGGIVAPPTFYCALDPRRRDFNPESGGPRGRWKDAAESKSEANAYDEVEFFEPIRAGDTITATSKITNIYERQGQAGRLVFVEREQIFTNQFGRIVAKCRGAGVAIY